MSRALTSLLLHLLLFLAAGGHAMAAPAAGQERVVFGVVPKDTNIKGVVVENVLPGSPAEKAGLRAGDHIWRVNAQHVRHKDALRQMLSAFRPGDVVRVQYLRREATRTALVELVARPQAASVPAPAEATEQVAVPYEIRLQMAQARARIRRQLGALPYRFRPNAVVADLQELRKLALALQVQQPQWMQGPASEAELEFADSQGQLLLHTRDGLLTLIIRDNQGNILSRYPLNSPQDARSLPRPLIHRLQAL